MEIQLLEYEQSCTGYKIMKGNALMYLIKV